MIIHHLLPRLMAAGPIDAADVAPALAKLHGHPMAKAAIEMAVLARTPPPARPSEPS